jgi:hypothetical protein
VTSVPLPTDLNTLPDGYADEAPYKVRLVDGSIVAVPPSIMPTIVDTVNSCSKQGFTIPTWLQSNQKVMFLNNGEYIKGHMLYDLDERCWRFSQRRRNGVELWGLSFPNFNTNFQQYIDDGNLLPGWHKSNTFIHGSANHVCAATLVSDIPPGSLKKGLDPRSPDKAIWYASYEEEFLGLTNNDTFEIISAEDYFR